MVLFNRRCCATIGHNGNTYGRKWGKFDGEVSKTSGKRVYCIQNLMDRAIWINEHKSLSLPFAIRLYLQSTLEYENKGMKSRLDKLERENQNLKRTIVKMETKSKGNN